MVLVQLEKVSKTSKYMKNVILKDKEIIDLSLLEKEVNFTLQKNEKSSLHLESFNDENNIEITLLEGSDLHLSIIHKDCDKHVKIHAKVMQNAKIVVYFADFSKGLDALDVLIELVGEGAYAEWHLAAVSTNKDNKNISVSILHQNQNTFARVDNYGVCKEESKLVFSGTSHIINGAVKSKTSQNAKIMVFDEKSDAIAKPILKIDENDIEANHAAVVGKISDEHLFYLTSRGVSVEDAKNLITMGYLKPILRGFSEDKAAELDKLIGGNF